MTARPSLSIQQAAVILGILETASISEIRSRYRELAKEWHPDRAGDAPGDSHENMVRLNEAYEVIMQYCLHYPIPFRPEDLRKAPDTEPMARWMERYGDDPIWGPYRSPADRRR